MRQFPPPITLDVTHYRVALRPKPFEYDKELSYLTMPQGMGMEQTFERPRIEVSENIQDAELVPKEHITTFLALAGGKYGLARLELEPVKL